MLTFHWLLDASASAVAVSRCFPFEDFQMRLPKIKMCGSKTRSLFEFEQNMNHLIIEANRTLFT